MKTVPTLTLSTLVLVLDLCGVFVFALSGAMAAIKHRFDVFGALVLSFVAANSGGIIRDVLIGAVPPPGIADWRYVTVPIAGGLATLRWKTRIENSRHAVDIFDAGGLAFFAVSGTVKALDHGLPPLTAIMLGMLTGVGGGVLRDVLTAEAPAILRGDIYALAALGGATIVVVGQLLQFPATAVAVTGAVFCFALRFVAIRRRWQLPVAWSGESTRQ